MNTKDVVIAYRIYPRVSKSPFVYPNDKLKLTEAGIHSFKKALQGLQYYIYFILDNCPPEYKSMILTYFNEDDIEFVEPNGIGNLSTFKLQIELLLSQNMSEYIFFAEDDYIYVDGAFQKMINFAKQNADAQFISPYDHLDAYELKIHRNEKYKIKIGEGLHWRTNSSSCLTFLTTKHHLSFYKSCFMSYTYGNWDSTLWYSITKYHVFKPYNYLVYIFTDFFIFKTFTLAWLRSPFTLLFKKKSNLWQPMPALATHMEKISLAPNVNWDEYVIKL